MMVMVDGAVIVKCGIGDVSMGEDLKDSGEEVRSLRRAWAERQRIQATDAGGYSPTER